MSRYSNSKIRKRNNVSFYATTQYEKVERTNEDIVVICQEVDRLDSLAFKYYGDSSLWWFIGRANGLYTMNIPLGTEIFIPSSTKTARGE